MKDSNLTLCHYMHISEADEKCGLVCTTAGMQDVAPGGRYPVDEHPDNYNFKAKRRVLHEYQLVYIISGAGVFRSASCPEKIVRPGTVIFLFPGEWHYYAPIKDVGWKEYWVGFRGQVVDNMIRADFFSREKPLFEIGYSAGIENCYNEIIRSAQQEAAGYQMLLSGIIHHMLGSIYFKNMANQYRTDKSVGIINSAREIMRANVESNLTVKDVADRLCVGYSWFRHKFKEYIGSSPTQYMLQLKFNYAKDMLSSGTPITEIAYALGFESISQFSNFFKRYAGVSPRTFRQEENQWHQHDEELVLVQ